MDGSGPREGGGVMKPVYLRVCIALVLSATGLIMARFVSWKEDNEDTSCASNPESSSSSSRNNDGKEEEKESPVDHQKQEIISFNSRLEELQRNNNEMELRFKRYCNLKDQKAMLMEQECMLVLEKSQLDLFRREVSAMEEELKRGHDLVIAYLKLVGEIQELRSKNSFLEGEAKKLRIRVKQLHRVVNQKSRKSIILENKLLKCRHELGGQVKDLEAKLDLLQEEKEVYTKSSENLVIFDSWDPNSVIRFHLMLIGLFFGFCQDGGCRRS